MAAKKEAPKAAAAQAVKAGDPVKITAGEFKGSSGTVITFEGQKPYLFAVVKLTTGEIKAIAISDVASS